MILRPPRSTRTDTLCPYTTLFRSLAPGPIGIELGKDRRQFAVDLEYPRQGVAGRTAMCGERRIHDLEEPGFVMDRSEEHTSELQSLMRISYAVFCLKKIQVFIVPRKAS